MAAFERWPSWNRDVKSMTMQGPVAPGSVFRWKAGPGTIESTIQRVEQPRLIAWTGKTLGIKAIHFWHLEPRDGKTFVRTEESYEGSSPGSSADRSRRRSTELSRTGSAT
jgi:Polyketide cyclase / dehydrase and lipid transport